MGRAKNRGTFEQRRAAALVLKAQRDEAAALERIEQDRIRREQQIESDRLYHAEHGYPRPYSRQRLPAMLVAMMGMSGRL